MQHLYPVRLLNVDHISKICVVEFSASHTSCFLTSISPARSSWFTKPVEQTSLSMQACTTKLGVQQVSLNRTKPTTARRSNVSVQATANLKSASRRSAGLMLVSLPMLFTAPAFARDADKAKAAAESRKEALAKAAEEMRESGKTASAFSESQYAVSEDKSPNVHTRQEEGVRESAD